MKAFRVLFVTLVLAAAGCIKMEQSLVLKADNSGTFKVSYFITDRVLQQLQAMDKIRTEMAKVMDGPQVADVDTMHMVQTFIYRPEERIKPFITENEKYGVRINTLKVQAREAGRQIALEVAFDDLSKVAEADFFQKHGFSLTKNGQGDYVLHRAAPKTEQKATIDLSNPLNVKLVEPFLGGFNVELRVTTPGRILKTNASARSDYSAVWSFDFDSDPESFVALYTRAFGILFEGEDIALPEIKREQEAKTDG